MEQETTTTLPNSKLVYTQEGKVLEKESPVPYMGLPWWVEALIIATPIFLFSTFFLFPLVIFFFLPIWEIDTLPAFIKVLFLFLYGSLFTLFSVMSLMAFFM